MAVLTGGTAPVSPTTVVRQRAAAKVVGQKTPAQKVKLNAPKQQQKTPKLPVARSSKPKLPQKAGAPKKQGPVSFNPLEGNLNSKQLGKLANRLTLEKTKAAVQPLKGQEKEIGQVEKSVANRYGQYSNTGAQSLRGIQNEAGTSAKTYQNNVAETTLKAAKEIEGTGQSATAQNGGYLDPQVQAALNAEGRLSAGIGSSQEQLSQNLGQGENDFISNLRAAAAVRAVQGQSNIASTYGKQREGVQQKISETRAKQPGEAANLAVELGQKQFTDQATSQSLGLKQVGAQQAQQKINLSAKQNAEHDRLSERGQNITASTDAERNALSGKSLAERERHDQASEKISSERAQAAIKKATGSGLTTSQQNRVAGELGTAWNLISQYRKAGAKSAGIREALTVGKANQGGKQVSIPKVSDQRLITAAFELYNLHKLTPASVQALKSIGVNAPVEWTNGQFKGF